MELESTERSARGRRSGVAELRVLFALLVAGLVVSGIAPYDRLTWYLEVAPVVIGLGLTLSTRARFPLTSLLYRLLFLHAVILILGGHYTYARVPLGFYLQDVFGLGRNPYDRIGHVAQGFVPAILTREILLRTSPLRPGAWLFFLTTCVCLAFSALYELLEWWAAMWLGADAESFLGTQGDVWDTQWDMALALSGAIASQLSFAAMHARALRKIGVGAARVA